MEVILTYMPFVISAVIGYLLIEFITPKKKDIPFLLKFFLASGTGLGISAYLTFSSFLIFDKLQTGYVIAINAAAVVLLLTAVIWKYIKEGMNFWDFFHPQNDDAVFIAVLIGLSLPLWYQGHFYVYGGWDAWSTWNLKAKVMYLAGEDWQRIFDPVLYRSSPHYPLLLPSINVWGWCFLDNPSFQVPVFTSYLFSLLVCGVLYASLRKLIKTPYIYLGVIVLITNPTFIKLSFSQYSDLLISYFLLSSLVCLILSKTDENPAYALLSGLMLGFLSFTKNEGLAAAVIIFVLGCLYLFFRNPAGNKNKQTAFFAAAGLLSQIPTVTYMTLYAPENLTFINGLTSEIQPSTWYRFKVILSFICLELGAPVWNILAFFKDGMKYMVTKWNAIWLVLIFIIAVTPGRSFRLRSWILPAFLISYTAATILYYHTNTYFPIEWWLSVTLHRILFGVLAVILFWNFYALWKD